MGFLSDIGMTYDYYESMAFQKLVKEKGIIQFLNLLKKFGAYHIHDHEYDHIGDPYHLEEEAKQNEPKIKLLWGDEFEGHVIKIFDKEKKVLLQPNTTKVFKYLEDNRDKLCFIPLPEFGSWMLETTPTKPYQSMCFNKDQVLLNMRLRCKQINESLPQNTYFLMLPVYPLLGCSQFTTTVESDLNQAHMEKMKGQSSYLDKTPTKAQSQQDNLNEYQQQEPNTPYQSIKQPIVNDFSKSDYFDDRIINPHPRYATLAQNIRLRRGSKVEIKLPIYKDINTKEDFVIGDHMGFGMGNCALQQTFLSIDIDHARFLYDQLAVLTPLFLSLTAGSPFFKGRLTNQDTKWNILEMSVDCRNDQERNPQSQQYIPKSRYSSISQYISNSVMNREEYDDVKFPRNEHIMNYAREKAKEMNLELDERLIKHLGLLFMRDNMALFKDKLQTNDQETTNHFEAIQSTNWNSVRFKPPPSFESRIGWRVEFRTCEIQLTPDENAAYSILILLIVRMFFKVKQISLINNQKPYLKINFYMPLSLVDKNFERAKEINSIMKQKFYFRTNVLDDEGPAKIEELTLDEIFFGKGDFVGISGLYKLYTNQSRKNICCDASQEVKQRNWIIENDIFKFIKQKTSGKIPTLATYIRQFIQKHPHYKQDSVINESINYDLIKKLIQIQEGSIQDPCFPKIYSQE